MCISMVIVFSKIPIFSNYSILLKKCSKFIMSFRITPDGVDVSDPLYERVAAIADDWLKEHGLT